MMRQNQRNTCYFLALYRRLLNLGEPVGQKMYSQECCLLNPDKYEAVKEFVSN